MWRSTPASSEGRAGAARLLGVLNLQSLPRRLSLDFRDLFQEGFASTTSPATSRSRKAWPSRTTCACAACSRGADGRARRHRARDAGPARHRRAEINAGTAALAYAVINPAIGLARSWRRRS